MVTLFPSTYIWKVSKGHPKFVRILTFIYACVPHTCYTRSSSVRQDRVGNKPTFQTSTVTHYNKFKKKVDKKYLEVGQNVMCIHNKEMATVKYIGHADFAPGIWIGLELKRQLGKHNGMVKDRRYFSSKEGHGVMVKPRNISVHGINGQELLRPESHYPI